MNFGEAVKTFFVRYTDFKGRSSRSEYWWIVLFNILVLTGLSAAGLTETVGLAYALGVLIPGVAVFVRRLHDTGKSAWYILFGLIPVVGYILFLIYMLAKSDPEENQYGLPYSTVGE